MCSHNLKNPKLQGPGVTGGDDEKFWREGGNARAPSPSQSCSLNRTYTDSENCIELNICVCTLPRVATRLSLSFRKGLAEDGRRGEERQWKARRDGFRYLLCMVINGQRRMRGCERRSVPPKYASQDKVLVIILSASRQI
jgi:hypothetical protein